MKRRRSHTAWSAEGRTALLAQRREPRAVQLVGRHEDRRAYSGPGLWRALLTARARAKHFAPAGSPSRAASLEYGTHGPLRTCVSRELASLDHSRDCPRRNTAECAQSARARVPHLVGCGPQEVVSAHPRETVAVGDIDAHLTAKFREGSEKVPRRIREGSEKNPRKSTLTLQPSAPSAAEDSHRRRASGSGWARCAPHLVAAPDMHRRVLVAERGGLQDSSEKVPRRFREAASKRSRYLQDSSEKGSEGQAPAGRCSAEGGWGDRGAGRAHKRWVVLEVGVQLEGNLFAAKPARGCRRASLGWAAVHGGGARRGARARHSHAVSARAGAVRVQ